jgi:hypothetical protein
MTAALRLLARALRGGCRLVALRRVTREDFPDVPELFAALIAIDIALMFVFSFVAFGIRGELNVYELSRALFYVPMVLLVGMFARRLDAGGALLTLPVAFAAASVVMDATTSTLYILAQRQLLPFAETYWFAIDYLVLAWSAAIVMNAAWRLVDSSRSARIASGVAALVLVVAPSFIIPQGLVWVPVREEASAAQSSFYSLAEERAFYAQQGALDRELEALEPQRRGVTDLYAVVAGLYAGEDVFMREANMISALLEKRFDAGGRTVMLVNNVKTLDEYPIATVTSLRESLARVGEVMDRNQDVLLLYVSSHGSDTHELVVDFRPLKLDPITPENLRSALDESGIRWKVVIVSACYSGGYIDALEDDHTLVITAARADRTSFGCGSASDATYLAKALFGEALAKTYSFEAAFAAARAKIEQWENEKGQTPPSEPQIYVGEKIRPKLAELERRLAAQHRTAAHRAQR